MPSIRIEGLAFAYSDAVPLFQDLEARIDPGFTGIVGANGAGKSTLLRLIAGELRPSRGTIALPRDALVIACSQTIEVCPPSAHALAADDSAGRLRDELALDPVQLERWATLSPGERRRWQLGGALAADPDVLLLDEPTNHVDATCYALLLAALRRFRGIGVVVSHDRSFLDELTSMTLRVPGGMYPGGYSTAKALWEADERRSQSVRDERRRDAKRAEHKLVAARVEHAKAAASRHTSHHKKNVHDHDASSMNRTMVAGWAEDQLGRRVEVARRDAERAAAVVPDIAVKKPLGRSIFVGFERAPRRWLFELEASELRAGDSIVLRDVRVAVGNHDRIRISGDNGSGKTTLLDALLATRSDSRVLVLPQELTAGAGEALLSELCASPRDVRGRTLQLVAALGADPDRLLASPSPSPGEARKLALALGLAQHAWCVVLDEPTNHFDLPSIERLEEALAAYPGALVLVSHDDAFATRLTTRSWRIHEGRIVFQ